MGYELDRLEERADAAAAALFDHLCFLERLFVKRSRWRQDNGIAVFAWCGHGRAGKDTSAEYFCRETSLIYPGSASTMMVPLVAHATGCDETRVWEERHRYREFWVKFCDAFRREDPTRIIRMCLATGDVAVGIRGKVELETGLRTGVLDQAVWIDNDRVAPDFTVAFGAQDCDFTLVNHGSLSDLYNKIKRLIRTTNAGSYHLLLQEGRATPFNEVQDG